MSQLKFGKDVDMTKVARLCGLDLPTRLPKTLWYLDNLGCKIADRSVNNRFGL